MWHEALRSRSFEDSDKIGARVMAGVMLVDIHTVFRQALAVIINSEPDLTVTAQAGTIVDALALVRHAGADTPVDLALVGLRLPDGDGPDLVHQLHDAVARRDRPLKIVVLTESTDRVAIARAVEAGAICVLHKTMTIDEIIAAIRRVAAGEEMLSPHEIVKFLRLAARQRAADQAAQQALGRLTPREFEVLRQLACGYNDRQIAECLTISHDTVRTHMVNVLNKLGVESRLQALVFAVRHGAVAIE
jgi:DNA-binding NarL/FixJ family response regulator